MPISDPRIQAALREVGLGRGGKDKTLEQRLDSNGLCLDDVLEELSGLIRTSTNENVRKSAIDTVLKMHGALKENNNIQIPSVTIVIQDPSSTSPINPILLPRQLSNSERIPQ